MALSIQDHCGIALAHTLEDAYLLAHHQNHRGQDTAGIGYLGPASDIYTVRWQGLVQAFDFNRLKEMKGFGSDGLFVSHTKYTTTGSSDSHAVLAASHPHYVGEAEEIYHEDCVNYLVTRGARKIMVHNGQVPDKTLDMLPADWNARTDCDTEVFLGYCDAYGIPEAIKNIPAAYSAILLDNERAYAFRDHLGIRPMQRGSKNGKTIIASESSAIRRIGGRVEEEVTPGSVVTIYPDGTYDKLQVVEPNPHPCVFEIIYIQDMDSDFYGARVRDVHEEFGRQLYREFGKDMPRDAIVIPVPNKPVITAQVFARQTGLEYVPALVKRTPQRSFLGLTQRERELSIKSNLYVDPRYREYVKAKTVVMVDDSIVRGTNSNYAVALLRELGAKEVYFLSGSPMLGGKVPVSDALGKGDPCTACFNGRLPVSEQFLTGSELSKNEDGTKYAGCHWGVHMPPSDSFITMREGRNLEQIRRVIGADYLGYMSMEGMLSSIIPKMTVLHSAI